MKGPRDDQSRGTHAPTQELEEAFLHWTRDRLGAKGLAELRRGRDYARFWQQQLQCYDIMI